MQSVKETLGKNLNIKELEKSYDSALQDEYFQMIVKELDLPKEVLQKYTSLLEDASRELACCNNCKSLSNCQNAIKGYCYKASNIAGEPSFSYRACKYLQSELARTKYEQNVQLYS